MGRLDRKIVVVTGGASGIGKAIVQRTAAEGASIVIADKQKDAGDAAAKELGVDFIEHDVCDETSWTRLMDDVERRYGRLDVLVNNAGMFGGPASIAETTLEEWRLIFAVNVDGVFLGCRAALPVIARSGGGSIVNTSSIAGEIATPIRVAYGASKAAVRQLTKSVAQWAAQHKMNVRCNSVHPGNVRTPQWDREGRAAAETFGVPFDDYVASRQALTPLGDFTKAEDVAATVAFLISDDGRHYTGAAMVVDGGLFNCDTYRPS